MKAAPESMTVNANAGPRFSRSAWVLVFAALTCLVAFYVLYPQLLLRYMQRRATGAVMGCRYVDGPVVYYRLSRVETSDLVGQIMQSTSREEWNKTNQAIRLSVHLLDADGAYFGRIRVKPAYASAGEFIDGVCDNIGHLKEPSDPTIPARHPTFYDIERSCR
jgi:hypothetical protein